MKRQIKAFQWSLAIHMMMAFAVVAAGSNVTAPIKINLVDFALVNTATTNTSPALPTPLQAPGKKAAPNSAPSPSEKRLAETKNKPPVSTQPQQPKNSTSTVQPDIKPAMRTAPNSSVMNDQLQQRQEQQPRQIEGTDQERNLDAYQVSPDTSPRVLLHAKNIAHGYAGQEKASGILSPPILTAKEKQEHYLAQHFIFIRDRIMQRLSYPAIARKKGWSGQVKLSFRINEDGSVDAITVVSSSGFAILDRHAMDTVKQVAPFPNPPERADITIPITYALRN
jgi:protein TonB